MSAPATDTVIVLLYSNSAPVRAQVRTAVGRRPAPDSPRIDWLECATSAELVEQMDLGGLDLAILDGATNHVTFQHVGVNPTSVAVNPLLNEVYVTVDSGGLLAIVDQ